ncbi:MAG: cyclic nucleotide-binding domain-containing protein [Acidobacteriota bacterium]|nr:cyclic nucleotide-binding domain-containing protein [Acidobacteriota bacterium]
MKLDPSAFIAHQSLIESLGHAATPLSIEQDQVLFRQGDEANALYILHSGEAKLTMKAPNGENVLQESALSGSLFGLPGVVGGMPYSLSVTAFAGAKVSVLSREIFSKIMLTEPALAVQVLQVLAAEVRSARSGMVSR